VAGRAHLPAGPPPGAAPGDAVAGAADAVSRLVDAVVPAPGRGAADLAATPARVAEAWLEDLVDGYRVDPAEVLADAMPSRGRDLVAVTGIDFHSMCPHHLLPSRGVAHVAYVPGGRVVGFGQLARLVDCFAHRLVLEEDLARQIAEALVGQLGARGAACVLDAEQTCLTIRGERRRDARAHAQCFLGVLASDARLQARFLALAGRAAPGRRARVSGRARVRGGGARGGR
jgi:GTP cyclohydrolase I